MRFKPILLAMASLTVLSACDQPTGPMAADPAVEQRFGPTSAIDPSTGELVALNYKPAGKVVTIPWKGTSPGNPTMSLYACDPYDPYASCQCDPYDPYAYCQCDPYDPYGGCYGCDPFYDPDGCPPPPPPPPCPPQLITGYSERRAGTLPYNALEVSGITSGSCGGLLVLTGIGARINGSDDYSTLKLRGRRLNPDGTWGETVDYNFGSSPYHSLEVWGEVPYSETDFYGIVGVGVGQSGTEDVRTLRIYYRKLELTTSGIRATGPTYQLYFGANPYGYLDVSYLTYADNEVFVGAGFRSYDDGERTKTMAAYIGTFP